MTWNHSNKSRRKQSENRLLDSLFSSRLMMKRLAIVLFRYDLRLHDNEVGAVRSRRGCSPVCSADRLGARQSRLRDSQLLLRPATDHRENVCLRSGQMRSVPTEVPHRISRGSEQVVKRSRKVRILPFLNSNPRCYSSICSALFTHRDTPENVLNQQVQQFKEQFQISIGFSQEPTKEETDVENAIRQLASENQIQVKEFWTSTLYHLDDLPYNNPKA